MRLKGFAHAIETAAGELESQSPGVARHIRKAARSVEGLSNNLRSRNVDELMHAASDLARSQPAVFHCRRGGGRLCLVAFPEEQRVRRQRRTERQPPEHNRVASDASAKPEPYFPAGSVSPKI